MAGRLEDGRIRRLVGMSVCFEIDKEPIYLPSYTRNRSSGYKARPTRGELW